MFSQTTEYALRAMTWLALVRGHLVPTGELAERTKVPMHYLAKVLQQLAAGGLVTGRRGVGGGYKLSRQPEDVRLIEIVRCVSPQRRERVREPGTHDSDALRLLEGVMDRIAADVIAVLDDMKLSDLVTDAAVDGGGPAGAGRTNGTGPSGKPILQTSVPIATRRGTRSAAASVLTGGETRRA